MITAELLRLAQQTLKVAKGGPSSTSVLAAFAVVALLPLAWVVPMTLLCLVVAARLPPWPAVGVIMAGAAVNTAFAWGLARGAFGARVQNWLSARGGWLGAVAAGARREPLKWAFLARYVPAPFVAAPMVLSTAGVGLGTTLAGTLLGMAPWTAVYVYAAHAGRQDSVRGFGRAALALLLGYVLLRLLRRSLNPIKAPIT
ncbi:MAG: VTT domain-containing protein, partial [bacterium]